MKLKKSFHLFSFLVTNFFLHFFLNSYLIKHMGKVIFGQLNMLFTILNNICPIILLGSYYLIIEKAPKLISKKNKKQLQILLNWGLRILFITAITLSFFSLTSILLQTTNLIPCHINACGNPIKIYIDALYMIPVFLIAFWNSSLFLSTKQQILAIILSPNSNLGILTTVISALSYIHIKFTGHSEIDYTTTVELLFASMLIICLFQYTFILLNKKHILHCSLSQWIWSREKQQKLRETANTHIFYDCLGSLVCLSIPIPIELAAPSSHTLAKYYICVIIGSFAMLLQGSMGPFMYEYLSRAGIEKEATEKLESMFKNLVRSGIIWFIISIIILLLFQKQILEFFHINNPHHMIIGIIIQMAYFSLSKIWVRAELILNYRNIMKPVYIANIVQIAIQTTLCYILVQKIGFLGPIIANIIGSLSCSAMCYTSLKKYKINIKPFGYI
ncbi:MAG: hypothetical protein VX737_01795 [Pseudomonadota bacterium]|nr:hypothetical protein [Pseudomonadota bacterium]